MQTVSKLLLILLLAFFAPAAFAQSEPEPYLASGRYVGTITVVEKIPVGDFTGLPPNALAKDYVSSKATGRVVATVTAGGGSIRILGTPGSNLLGYLDEPNFAAIKMTFALEGNTLVPVSANAREGAVTVVPKGNRIHIAHDNLFYKRLDYAHSDADLLGHLSVRIELTRTGR